MPEIEVLLVELRGEIEHLMRLNSEAAKVLPRFSVAAEPEPFEIRALAALSAEVYSGVEFAMQRVADRLGEELPGGGNWHRALLDQMSRAVPDLRPALFRPETTSILEGFRQFRHLAHHRYGESLEWETVLERAQEIGETTQAVVADLEAFCAFLLAVTSEDNP